MVHLPAGSSDAFLGSKLPVGANAVKNILFRAAVLALNFALFRLFALWAFRTRDYTAYLFFAEDIVQKILFAVSRRLNRQGTLVLVFAAVMLATGFYDTLLWGLDYPGYIIKVTRTNAGLLSAQMLDNPAYVLFVSDLHHDLSRVNLNDTLSANLYATGANYTLPGVVDTGVPEAVPAGVLLSPVIPPSIWLDAGGFAVGLDETIMTTPTMNASNFCAAFNSPSAPDTLQTWRCLVQNSDALGLFEQNIAKPQIWWDTETPEYLGPVRNDNPWQSLGTGGDTALMEQVFTVTKDTRRHTFLQTTLKATMISRAPVLLDDGEIIDFMHKVWDGDPSQPITPPTQALANLVIEAKNNLTSVTFGSFVKTSNTTVSAFGTDYLNVLGADTLLYASLRFVSNTITLLRSDTLFSPPIPFATCDQAYSNIATGGVARSSNCYNFLPTNNSTRRFLGQIDTSAVLIMSDILGQGTQNLSSIALNPDALAWYTQNAARIEDLLISRAYILGGVRAAVQVDVRTTVAALSYLQLLLILLPIILALAAYAATARRGMGYFKNSLLSTLYTTLHAAGEGEDGGGGSCRDAAYVRAPVDIQLRMNGEHVVLGMRDGGIISTVSTGTPVSFGYGLGHRIPLLHKGSDAPSMMALKEGSA